MKLVAAVAPNDTAVAAVKPVPVMATLVPPAVGPLVGAMPVTAGAATKVNLSPAEMALVPPAVVTVMSTVPAPSAGEVAVMEVALFDREAGGCGGSERHRGGCREAGAGDGHAGPARRGPLVGAMPVTAGAPTKVNLSPAEMALVPPAVVTVMSTVPAPSAGEVAVMEVALFDREAGGRRSAERHRGGCGEAGAGDGHAGPARRGPLVGAMPVTTGAPTKVNLSPAEMALVPPAVVTVMSTVPAPSAGEVAVMEVALFDREAGGRRSSERHCGGCREAGAGDGHAGPARRRPAGRSDAGYRRCSPRR